MVAAESHKHDLKHARPQPRASSWRGDLYRNMACAGGGREGVVRWHQSMVDPAPDPCPTRPTTPHLHSPPFSSLSLAKLTASTHTHRCTREPDFRSCFKQTERTLQTSGIVEHRHACRSRDLTDAAPPSFFSMEPSVHALARVHADSNSTGLGARRGTRLGRFWGGGEKGRTDRIFLLAFVALT